MRIALGLSLCLFSIVIVLSFMQALQRDQFEDIRTFESFDLQIPLSTSNYVQAREIASVIESLPEVDDAFVYVDLPIIAQNSEGSTLAGRLRAIEATGRFFQQLNSYRGTLFSEGTIISSYSNARIIRLGETLNITYLRKGRQAAVVPSQRDLEVGAIYYTDSYDFDKNTFLTDVPTILSLNPDLLLRIGIFTKSDVKTVKGLLTDLGYPQTETWMEVNASLYGAMELEQKMMTLMLFMMVAVILVHIRNSSRRLLLAKQSEIAMLRSMGLTKNKVRTVFLLQALIVAMLGIGVGILLSYSSIALYPYMSQVAYRAMGIHLTLEIQAVQLVLLIAAILSFSLLAAYFGTRRILKADIMEMFAHDEIS